MDVKLDHRVREARVDLHNAADRLRDAHAMFVARATEMEQAIDKYREANAALGREDAAMFTRVDAARELAKAGDSVERLNAQEKL
jgi:hypothetical protein